jgi:hypothetical protein
MSCNSSYRLAAKEWLENAPRVSAPVEPMSARPLNSKIDQAQPPTGSEGAISAVHRALGA